MSHGVSLDLTVPMSSVLLALPTGGPTGEHILVTWDGLPMNKSPSVADNVKFA